MNYVIDAHCDTILKVETDCNLFFSENEMVACSLPNLLKGNIGIQFMASYIESNFKPHNALRRGLELVETTWLLIEKANGRLVPILRVEDLGNLAPNKVGVILCIEGGEVLEDNPQLVSIFYKLGVRLITLTWNQKNLLASGTWDTDNGGLSRLGQEVIARMNELGMLIDVSHMTPQSIEDTIKTSKEPVIASHSNCYGLWQHPRNIHDDNLKLLAEKGGVVCISLAPQFMSAESATVDDVCNHIAYAIKVAGEDHVGFGSDFDGVDSLPVDITDSSRLSLIWTQLAKKGIKSSTIDKITGKNVLRLLKKSLK